MDKVDNQLLIMGDAIEKLKGLSDGKSQDKLEFDEYIEFSKNWISECCRVLKDNGSIYVFMGMRYISYIYEILEKNFGLTFNGWITWFQYLKIMELKYKYIQGS